MLVARHEFKKAQEVNINGHMVEVEEHETNYVDGHFVRRVLSTYNNVPTTAISSSTEVLAELRHGTCNVVRNPYLRVKVNAASQIQHKPASHMIKQILCWSQNGSGEQIDETYKEPLGAYPYIHLNEEQRKHFNARSAAREVMYSDGSMKYWVADNVSKSYLQSGETKFFYIPLPFPWLWNGFIDMVHCKSILFKITFDADWILSGTAADVTVQELVFDLESLEESSGEASNRRAKLKAKPQAKGFLSVKRKQDSSNTLTASSNTDFNLDFNHKSAFLMFCLKNGANPTGLDDMRTFPINGGTFDFVDSGGQSLLGLGNPLTYEAMLDSFSQQFKASPIRGYHVIPFSDKCLEVYEDGNVHGYRTLSSNRQDKIRITFPAAGTAHVITLTFSNTNSAGYYRIYANGKFSAPLAYNAAASAIKSAIEALLYEWDVTVTASQAVSAGTSLTLTFNAKDLRISDELPNSIQFISDSLTGGGLPENPTSSNSVWGTRYNWTTSSAYQMNMYSFYYAKMVMDVDGNLYFVTM